MSRSRAAWWPALACGLVTALVYLPALSNGFVSWDDPEVLLENLHVRRLDATSLRWMWSSFHTGNWIPLTWLSHALVYRVARLDPWAHHAANVALHVLNTGLVFLLARALLARARERGLSGPDPRHAPWAAATASLLFGLHPLHVESVAWIAERKDVLYTPFFLLAMLAALWRPQAPERRRWPAWLTLLAFLLALLAKPMAVTLPLALLALDVWPLGRRPSEWRAALVEKAPLFVVAAASAAVTVLAQSAGGAVAPIDQVSVAFRAMNALHSVAFYLWKMLVPLDLLPLYPIGRTASGAFGPANVVAALAVVAVSAAAAWKGGRATVAAWAFYLVTLAPVLGLVQVGTQLAADRYTYVPSLGPFLVAAVLLTSSRGGRVVAALWLAALVPLTTRQIATWKDSVTLWERVVSARPGVSAIAHTNLGNAYRGVGRTQEAVAEFRKAIAVGPDHAFIENGLGTALLDLGQVDAALAALQKATALEPSYAVAYRNLWFAWEAKGDPARARAAAEAAVRWDRGYADGWSSLGVSQGRAGDLAAAEASFLRALALDPDNPDFATNLAIARERLRRSSP